MGAEMPGGAPTKLTPAIAAEIEKYLSLGCYPETAVAMAGLNLTTFRVWMKRGAREKQRRDKLQEELEQEAIDDKGRQRNIRTEERNRRAERAADDKRLCASEQKYVDFHTLAEQAIAKAELQDLAVIATAARGAVIETRKTIDPKTGATTVTEVRARPQWQAAAWRLERRFPKKYARVQRLEVEGDTPDDVKPRRSFADAMAEAAQRKLEREKKKQLRAAEESKDAGGARVPDEIIEAPAE